VQVLLQVLSLLLHLSLPQVLLVPLLLLQALLQQMHQCWLLLLEQMRLC
jgi:hypothetical protein